MGIFDEMLAGGVAGLGRGMSEYAAADEREKARKEEMQQRADLQRELAGQKSENYRDRYNLDGLNPAGAPGTRGSGGGRSGGIGAPNVVDAILNARRAGDDKELELALAQAEAMAPNKDAVMALRNMAGRPMEETVDLNRERNTPVNDDEGNAMPSANVTRAAGYDRDRGAQALNRMLAMAGGKFKDYAEGEQTTTQTDLAMGANTDQQLREAGARVGAMEGKDRFGEAGGTVYDKFQGGKGQITDVGKSMATENYAQGRAADAKASRVNDRSDPETMRMRADYTSRERTLRTQLNGNNVNKAEKANIQTALTELLDERKAFEEQVAAAKPGKGAPRPAPAPTGFKLLGVKK